MLPLIIINRLRSFKTAIHSLLKSLLVLGLVVALVFSHADGALAARGGGRIGGGSFRAPRTFSPPGRSVRPPARGYPGGGFGFPFLIPFFGIGGFGSLFTILIFIAIANFLFRSFQSIQGENNDSYAGSSNPPVTVARLQVGLLAQARNLQADLDQLARKADTSSSEGLTEVLQETSLALLRHPEYWVYGATEVEQTRLQAAESQFNRLSLAERSKFSAETLSNFNNQLKQSSPSQSLPGEGQPDSEGPSEYIVVTLLVGVTGKLRLPKISGTEDLQQALRQLGGIGQEQLLAVEVLWTPQAAGEVLTAEDLLVEYPSLKRI